MPTIKWHVYFPLQINAEISHNLLRSEAGVTVLNGDTARLTSEVMEIAGRLPKLVQEMSGVDINEAVR